MACIVYQKHKNGSTYAYRSESFRDPRTGKPTSRREYIGRVDPDTGAIVPKRSRKRREAAADTDAAADGGYEVRIAELEAENARLTAALREAMGHVGDALAAMGGALDGEEEGGRGGPGGGP